ncbi:MAG: DUF92 domain-containing protein [Candidatus Micrarchaeota archaeon]|nr:DUF92 domain-containing protein [Candidatus Micrarchaeota archaeon]
MNVFTLNARAGIVAVVVGILLLFFGGPMDQGPLFVAAIFSFLVLSTIVTSIGVAYKKKIRVYELVRGVSNVLSNSAGPLLFAFTYWIGHIYASEQLAGLSMIGFMASVAAITADKFGSEIGVLGKAPVMIFTFKKVKKGVSGGVSLLGLVSGLVAAVIISAWSAVLVPTIYGLGFQVGVLGLMGIISLGGFAGTVVDSMVGYFETKGMGTKATTNVFCGVVGGLVGFLLLALVG